MILLSVEQLQSEERIIEGRTAVDKRGKRVTTIVIILAYIGLSLLYWAQSPIPGSVSYMYTGLSLFYLSHYKIATRSSQLHYGYL